MAFDDDDLLAADSREAEEGDHLQLKRGLPQGEAGAREIGKDLAAKPLGGGVILVGASEAPTSALTPITLSGHREPEVAAARAGRRPRGSPIGHVLHVGHDPRATTWTRKVVRKFAEPQRPHLRRYLNRQGFRFQ